METRGYNPFDSACMPAARSVLCSCVSMRETGDARPSSLHYTGRLGSRYGICAYSLEQMLSVARLDQIPHPIWQPCLQRAGARLNVLVFAPRSGCPSSPSSPSSPSWASLSNPRLLLLLLTRPLVILLFIMIQTLSSLRLKSS